MWRKNIEKVSAYLDKSLDSYLDFSFRDDSDADPGFLLPGTSKDPLPISQSRSIHVESDTSGESFEVSSSADDVSDANNNNDQWYENWDDIPELQFDSSASEIQLNIPNSARENPIQIFEML